MAVQLIVTPSSASDINVEVVPVASQTITIDRGVAGPVGMTWRGDWSSATAYSGNDAVYYAVTNASYICIVSNTNQVPTNTAYWQLLVSGAGNVTGAASSADNAIARFDGTTGKVIQNSAVYIDDSGNLGIGTSSPGAKLDVRGNAYIGVGDAIGGFGTANKTLVISAGAYNENLTAALTLTGGFGNNNTPSGWSIQSVASGANSLLVNTLLFGTTSYTGSANAFTERMRLDSSGNLGLGVTPSAWTSSTAAFEQAAGAIYSITSGTWDLAQNAYNSATGLKYRSTSFASLYRQTSGQHVWFTAPSGTAGNAISFTQAMTLDNSGNLYIANGKIGPNATQQHTMPAVASDTYTLNAASQTLTNKTLTDPTIIGTITEDVFTITDGASVDLNPANGSIQLWTLGANRTATATNFLAGEAMTVMVNDGTAYALTWPTTTWVGGSPPVLATTGYTVVELWKVSSTLYGAIVGYVA